MANRFFIILGICILLNAASWAKEFPMRHFTIEDGLPSNTIYDIYEDENGILWIGTDKGISRFNGITFENFSTADGLSDNECFYFRKDTLGRLWIATLNGDLCYYKDGVFHNYKNTAFLRIPKSPNFRQIKLFSDGTLGFFSPRDPKIYLLKGERFILFSNQFLVDKSQAIENIITIQKQNDAQIKVFYSRQSVLIDSVKMITIKNLPSPISESLYKNGGEFLISTTNEILNSDFSKTNFYCKDKLQSAMPHRISITNTQHQLIATNKGLFIDSFDALLPNSEIHTVVADRFGDYWFGTKKDGLFHVNKSFYENFIIKQAYNSTIMFANNRNRNLVYVTADGNLFMLHESIPFCILNKLEFDRKYFMYSYDLLSTDFSKVFRNDWNLKLFFYRFSFCSDFLYKNVTNNKSVLSTKYFSNNFNKIIINNHFTYFNNRHHISFVNTSLFLSKTYKILIRNVSANLNQDPIFGFTKGIDDKSVWISTLKSVYKINDSIPIEQKQFVNLSFREFIFSGKQLLGISHTNDLLLCKNIESKKVIVDSIYTKDCIWDKLYTINDSTVFISTNNFPRILTLYPSNKSKPYKISVLDNPFIPYQSEYIYFDSINAYFFHKGSISSFPKEYIIQPQPIPSLVLNKLITAQGEWQIKDTLSVAYKSSKNIKIKFTPVSFYHKNLSYEYTLNTYNQQDKWVAFAGEELNIIKLGYGTFTIKVRVKTLSGDYSSLASFVLIVHKPYWATWWFLSLCLLALVTIVALLARQSIKRGLLKKEGEVRFLRSEYKAMNALMNPHFIFNSLNSVQSLVNNNENNTASRYIRIFSDLIRQNMHNIAQDLIPLSKELHLVDNYLKIEQLRFKEKLNYTIDIADDIEADIIMVPPLLIQPLVENAIKHGIWPKKTDDGRIDIKVFEKASVLHVTIVDNGNGLQKSNSDTLHESYAMSNIYKRLEQLSTIHLTKIDCTLIELKDKQDNVIGVQAEIKIELPD